MKFKSKHNVSDMTIIPFSSLKESVSSECFAEIASSVVDGYKTASPEVRRLFETALREKFKLPVCQHNVLMAPPDLIKRHLPVAIRKVSSLMGATLHVWVSVQNTLRKDVDTFIRKSDEDLSPVPIQAKGFSSVQLRSKLDAMLTHFLDAAPNYKSEHAFLMLCWRIGCAPMPDNSIQSPRDDSTGSDAEDKVVFASTDVPQGFLQKDTVMTQWQRYLEPWLDLPDYAHEWDHIDAFIDALQELCREKRDYSILAGKRANLHSAIEALTINCTDALLYWEMEVKDWQIDRCAGNQWEFCGAQAGLLHTFLLEHQTVRRQIADASNRAQEQQFRLRQVELEQLIPEVFHTLCALLTSNTVEEAATTEEVNVDADPLNGTGQLLNLDHLTGSSVTEVSHDAPISVCSSPESEISSTKAQADVIEQDVAKDTSLKEIQDTEQAKTKENDTLTSSWPISASGDDKPFLFKDVAERDLNSTTHSQLLNSSSSSLEEVLHPATQSLHDTLTLEIRHIDPLEMHVESLPETSNLQSGEFQIRAEGVDSSNPFELVFPPISDSETDMLTTEQLLSSDSEIVTHCSSVQIAQNLGVHDTSQDWNNFFWSLIAENDLIAAYWLASANEKLEKNVPISSSLLAVLQASCWLTADTDTLASDIYEISKVYQPGTKIEERLISLAAALCPVLLAPSTLLLNWLSVSEDSSILTRCTSLSAIVKAVEQFAQNKRALRREELHGATSAAERRGTLEQMQRELQLWWDGACHLRPNHRRARLVWDHLRQHHLHKLVAPILNAKLTDVTPVGGQLQNLVHFQDVNRLIDEVNRKELAATGYEALVGGIRNQLIREIQEACRLVRRWDELVEREHVILSTGDWLFSQVSELRSNVVNAMSGAVLELQEMTQEGQPIAIASAARCLLRALSHLRQLMEISDDTFLLPVTLGIDNAWWLCDESDHQENLGAALAQRLFWTPAISLHDDGLPVSSDLVHFPALLRDSYAHQTSTPIRPH